MSWIVVLESEGRQADSIRDALVEDGWQVELASTSAAATAAVGSRAAQLFIANAELPGAAELLRRFAHAASGPGSIALVAPGKKGSKSAEDADERLSRPFDDNELRLAVRRLVTAGRAPKVAAPVDEASRLTSRDLFGDLLSEVEGESGSRPAAGSSAAPVPRPAPTAASSLDAQISNLRPGDKPKSPAAKRESQGIDDLLSKTLSGLEAGAGIKRPAAPKVEAKPPAPAAPAAPKPVDAAASLAETVRIPIEAAKPKPSAPPAEPPKPPTPKVEAPKPAPPKVEAPRIVEPPKAAPPAPKPAAPAPAPPAPPAPKTPAKKPEESRPAALETTPARRATKDLDLSALDALAKGKAKEKGGTGAGAADAMATQKIAFPGTAALRAGQAPMEFGQYTLLERIALGGMAEVWKARRKGVEGFQKTVAIKKILPHLTDSSDFVTMFIDEAKLAAQLNHTNIIHIYDLGKIGEDFFIAMEYVDGKDLRSILNAARDRKMPMPLGLALLVASRLASALDYAHRKKDADGKDLGLVHRDVSPQNVLIAFEGDIKLCDFGIVKAASKASKTQMGALKGKLQYMSPEQAWGRPVDARSDIFSLGALIFEMLTGQRLFMGESEMSVLDAVREGRVQAPRDLDPRLPLEVNALVLKALAKEPKDRFASGGDLHRELDAILASLKPAPTQLDLSRYMAKLFDTEPRAAAAESAPVAAPAPSEPPAPKPAAVVTAPPQPARAPEPALAPAPGHADRADAALESAPAGGNKMIGIGIAAALVVGVVAWMLVGKGSDSSAPPATPAPSGATAPESAPAPAATPNGGTPAQPAATPATKPATTPATPATPADTKPAPAAPEAPATKAEDDAAKKRAEEQQQREDEAKKKADADAAAKAAAEAKKAEAPAPVAAPSTPPVATPEPQPAAPVEAPKPEPAAPTPQVAQPAPARPAVPVPAPPKAPSVREGDLVTAGAGVRLPVLVSFNKPEYPPIARRMKVEGTVVLSLLVDETGRVVDVRVERGVSQNVGLNEAATAAARTAKYQPATKDGVKVKIWHTLTIPFKL